MFGTHEILERELAEYGLMTSVSDAKRAQMLRHVSYAETCRPPLPDDVLLVVTESEYLSDFSQQAGSFLILAESKRLVDGMEGEHANIFLIPPEADGQAAVRSAAACLGAIQIIDRHARSILELLGESKRDIQSFMDLAAQMLDNPVALLDYSTVSFIAKSAPEHTGYAVWDDVVYGGASVADHPRISAEFESFKSMTMGNESVLFEADSNSLGMYVVTIRHGSTKAYFFHVLESRHRFTKVDLALSRILSLLLGELLLNARSGAFANPHRVMEEFFDDAVSKNLDDNAILRSAYMAGVSISEPTILALVYDKNEQATFRDIMGLQRHLERNLKAIGVIIHGYSVAVLARKDDGQLLATLPSLLESRSDVEWRVAVSLAFSDATGIRRAYDQCRAARRLGSDDCGPVLPYEHVMRRDLLESFPDQGKLQGFVLPVALEMLRYDQEHGSELSKTVYLYLCNYADRKQTADALHIHFNSIGYRLHKAEEVFGLNLLDYRSMAALQTSFEILEAAGRLP